MAIARPDGIRPSTSNSNAPVMTTRSAALSTWQWYALWAILFFNTMAGISIISQAAPLAQEVIHVSEVAAAGLVGIVSVANGAGRFLWAWFSDFIGRARVFQVMFLAQAIVSILTTGTCRPFIVANRK
jgi:OFA family oxalate/formate antiporter-like MFS transporter